VGLLGAGVVWVGVSLDHLPTGPQFLSPHKKPTFPPRAMFPIANSAFQLFSQGLIPALHSCEAVLFCLFLDLQKGSPSPRGPVFRAFYCALLSFRYGLSRDLPRGFFSPLDIYPGPPRVPLKFPPSYPTMLGRKPPPPPSGFLYERSLSFCNLSFFFFFFFFLFGFFGALRPSSDLMYCGGAPSLCSFLRGLSSLVDGATGSSPGAFTPDLDLPNPPTKSRTPGLTS